MNVTLPTYLDLASVKVCWALSPYKWTVGIYESSKSEVLPIDLVQVPLSGWLNSGNFFTVSFLPKNSLWVVVEVVSNVRMNDSAVPSTIYL